MIQKASEAGAHLRNIPPSNAHRQLLLPKDQRQAIAARHILRDDEEVLSGLERPVGGHNERMVKHAHDAHLQ